MAETKNLMFSLHLAGNLCPDFYPYELFLEEGISTVYKAELTILTDTLHTREDLLDLLDKAATITVFQNLDGALKRSRFLHGIVTGVKNRGVFSNGKEKDCYSHVLTIESCLARLRYNRATAPYYRISPVEAIREILKKNQLGADDITYLERTAYSKHLLFEQQETSDLEFIQGLLYLYGLSYTFCQPAPSGNGGLGQAELYLSGGKRYPAPGAVYSDKRKIPDTLQFDFLRSDEPGNIWKMDAWSMADRIGTDGLEVNASYPDANHGSPNWRAGETGPLKRYFAYNRLFHGYERNTPTAEIDDDIMLILDARRRTLELSKSVWTGEAANLLLQPGAILELAHFYGKNNNTRIKARITASRLHCRTSWPQTLAVPPEGAAGETLNTAVTCMNYGGGNDREKRFCGER
ncbi:MAG: phage late control D family protein [Treponema sp.]|jgi:uncharacterized protein involved in type VI secretion and phage assembly|nr:phage late control D family protein [Treponema sp.]